MLEQLDHSVMEMVCVQAVVTWNRFDYVVVVVKLDTVMDIGPGNVAVNRVAFRRRIRSEMVSTWIDNAFDESALIAIKLQHDLYNRGVSNGRMMDDGLTKLKLILEDIQAVKVVGMDAYY